MAKVKDSTDKQGSGPRLKAIDGGLGQQDLHRALVEGCPDPLMVLQDNRVQFINPAFTSLLGYTPQVIEEGLSIYTLVQEADRSDVRGIHVPEPLAETSQAGQCALLGVWRQSAIGIQPGTAAVPSGYLKDAGSLYSSSRGYGWSTDLTN